MTLNRTVTARQVAVAVCVSLFGLALLGCVRQPTDSGSGEPPALATHTPRPSATGQSLEGRFTFDTMNDYVDAILPMITQWMKQTWPNMPIPQVIYVPHGARGAERCLGPDGRRSLYSGTSYEYCAADQIVYVGQDMLFAFYDRTGDAGPAVGLAHEFGHHIQQEVGVPEPQTAAENTRHEDQADCLAGAWTQYTDQQGWLEYPDDIQDIDALFPLIGSAEGPDRDHGTADERLQSFQEGFTGGVTACDSFYPTVSLLGV